MMRWRSLLFVSANDDRRIAKAAERGADAIILDLKDAVPTAEKAAAGERLPASIERLVDAGAQIVIRINVGWIDAFADLDAAVRPGVAAIMVPKAEDKGRLEVISQIR